VSAPQAEPMPIVARLGRLTLLFLAHAVGTANITLVLAMAPVVERELGLSHTAFGLVVATYYGALTLWALPAGWLVDRLGIRFSLIAAQVLLAIGMLIVAASQGVRSAAIGLALCGTGYALVNPATARGVLMWFPTRGRATAMGMKQTGVPAGAVAIALVAAAGGEAWRDLALILAGVTLVAAVGFAALGTAGPPIGTLTSMADMRRLLRRSTLAWFNAAACLYAAAQSALFAYLVLFVHEVVGASVTLASLCLAMAHAASAIGRIGWGLVGDLLPRHGRWVGLIACGILGGFGVALLAAMPAHVAVAGALAVAGFLGFTVGGYAALAQTTTVEVVEPQLAGAAIGYNMLLTTTGSMLGPALFGFGLDQSGFATSWSIVAIILLIGAALFLVGFRAHQWSR
jgi:predicted MFS family arabinose efflux permease